MIDEQFAANTRHLLHISGLSMARFTILANEKSPSTVDRRLRLPSSISLRFAGEVCRVFAVELMEMVSGPLPAATSARVQQTFAAISRSAVPLPLPPQTTARRRGRHGTRAKNGV